MKGRRRTAPRSATPPSPPPGLEALRVIGPDGEWIVLSFPVEGPRLPAVLSEAERGVVQGALEGLTNAQIARARGTSVHTVANQLANAVRKLGIRSRSELAALLLRKPT